MALTHGDPEPQAWCTAARFTPLTSSQPSSTFSRPHWHTFGVSRGNCLQSGSPRVPSLSQAPRKGRRWRRVPSNTVKSSAHRALQPGWAGPALCQKPSNQGNYKPFPPPGTLPPATQHTRPHPDCQLSAWSQPQTRCPQAGTVPRGLLADGLSSHQIRVPTARGPPEPTGEESGLSRGSSRFPQTTGCRRRPEGKRAAFSRQLEGGRTRRCEGGEPHFPAMHILGHKAELQRAKKLFGVIREKGRDEKWREAKLANPALEDWSLGAWTVKNPPAMQDARVQSLGWEDPRKGMATHSSILAWKTPWAEEPGGLQPGVTKSQTWPSDTSNNS